MTAPQTSAKPAIAMRESTRNPTRPAHELLVHASSGSADFVAALLFNRQRRSSSLYLLLAVSGGPNRRLLRSHSPLTGARPDAWFAT